MPWLQQLSVRDVRNLREATVELHPQINVFHGRNAQGKTSLLEAVGLVARGRSFRTDDTPSMIRRGASVLSARGHRDDSGRSESQEVELRPASRVYRLDGRPVPPSEYSGRLEVVVYSSDRLRVVRGSMRERRQFLDRQAAALWPAYRAELREFERVLAQRNAALESRSGALEVWSDRFIASGARLRQRRAAYAERLSAALGEGFRPCNESYALVSPEREADDAAARQRLAEQLRLLAARERAARRSLAGPHRDEVRLLLDGRDASDGASSGQARSLLLALTLASLRVHEQETGRAAVALLDDLDSELDAERAGELCAEVARRGQALVTSAHPQWAESLRPLGRIFEVSGGQVRCA